VNGVASSNFSATTANTYNLGVSSFSIGGIAQSGYSVKCLNTTTLVLNDCALVIKSPVHHYAISHTSPGVTCEAEGVTIEAHTALHAPVAPSSATTISLSTAPVTLGASEGWTSDAGNGGVFSAPNKYRFNGVETSVKLWLTKTTAATMNIDVNDGTVTDLDGDALEDKPLEFRDTALRFYAAGNHNTIATQIAGKPSNTDVGSPELTVRAIQTNTDTGACEARLTGKQNVLMAFECVTPSTCAINNGVSIIATPIAGIAQTATPFNNLASFVPVELTFDGTGKAIWTMNYLDAGRIALHASLSIAASPPDPADILQGSSNAFVSKPAGLCVSSPDANANCAAAADVSCTKFKKAGEAFNLAVRAVAWQTAGEADTDFCIDNTTTPNFQLANIGLLHNPVAPLTVFPGLAGSNSISIASAGDASIAQTLSEVGIFRFTATAPAYLGTSIAPSTSASIGRFYPDHFVLSGPGITNRVALGGGGSFTYMGEDLGLSYTLTAKNAATPIAATTENYSSAVNGFARLDTPAELNYAAADTTLPFNLTSRLTTGVPVMSWLNGVMVITDTARISRNTTADGPFLLDIGLAPVDEDLVKLASYDMDVDATPPNDHALIATTQIRFGRISLSNTFGSELQALSMPLNAEYFNGTHFVPNFDDSLTPLTTAGFVLSSAIELGQTDGDVQVVAGKTSQLTFNNALLAGNGGLSFCPPGNPACTPEAGNAGFIDVRLDLSTLPYLQFDWDGNGVVEDPLARATFGIFSGNSRQIYYRQIFQ